MPQSNTGDAEDYQIAPFPAAAQQPLAAAIAPETRLASGGVRLRMHGEIKLRRWFPFTAEQVISGRDGMIWTATVRMSGIPLFRGFDRLLSGEVRSALPSCRDS